MAALERARASFARKSWKDAYSELAAADREAPLDPDHLELLATVAYLVGHSEESLDTLARAHRAHLDLGDVQRAALAAFWIGFPLLVEGERARANGWLTRAQRLVDDAGLDCVARGYLRLPTGFACLVAGDGAGAYAAFCEAVAAGVRFADPDLLAFARHGQGRALIKSGSVADGIALLDEAMISVTSGELSPIMSGSVYCSVIDACHETFDMRRAQEWTDALTRWCESQPDLVPHRGVCLVHRAELLQLHGDWSSALEEVSRASEWLAGPPAQPGTGGAFYRRAELHRLRGETAEAEAAYREASNWGRTPQPGLAQLRLAQGKAAAAASAVRQLLTEVSDRRARSRILAACVDVLLDVRDLTAARVTADELSDIDVKIGAPYLHAMAAHANGAVLLAEGRPQHALAALRDAWSTWCDIGAPYESARTRVLIALANRELGDEDSARMELDAARATFRQLGATPDVARIEALERRAASEENSKLTSREMQVLRLVATGKTNRGIATSLGISEKTVARHVSNIFTKLALTSRAAATAYAYEHGVLSRTT